MKVYLARHGQTNYNVRGLCNDDPSVDVHLTKIGIWQSKKLATRLEHGLIQQIFVSELQRTKQTADIINKYHNASITVDSRLNDIETGFESKSVLQYFNALNRAEDKWTIRFNDGESFEDVKERVADFIKDLKEKEYSSVLIVTSKVIVQAFYGISNKLSKEEAWEFQVKKGSCIELKL